MSDEIPKIPTDRQNDFDARMDDLEAKLELNFDDIEIGIYGQHRDPERKERLRRIGLLERLQRLERLVDRRTDSVPIGAVMH